MAVWNPVKQIEEQTKQPFPTDLMPSATNGMKAKKRPPPAIVVEIGALRAAGCSNGAIAERLGIRKKYVGNYVWKYGVTSDGHIRHADGNPFWTSWKITNG
jgi:hypothetical protein